MADKTLIITHKELNILHWDYYKRNKLWVTEVESFLASCLFCKILLLKKRNVNGVVSAKIALVNKPDFLSFPGNVAKFRGNP